MLRRVRCQYGNCVIHYVSVTAGGKRPRSRRADPTASRANFRQRTRSARTCPGPFASRQYAVPSKTHERAKRWAVLPFDREELPARAFYATDPSKRDLLDQAMFEAWGEGLDVNEPATIEWAAERAALEPRRLTTE